jgi:galactose-6-phosphate isomerase
VLDPDFVVSEDDVRALQYTRNVQSVGQNGRTIVTPMTDTFAGTVLNEKGRLLTRESDGTRIKSNIVIFSRFRLQAGDDTHAADIVTWESRQYTVMAVKSYASWGRGYVKAICELIPLAGGTSPAEETSGDE